MWKKVLGWSILAVVLLGILLWLVPQYLHIYPSPSSCNEQTCILCGKSGIPQNSHDFVSCDCGTYKCTQCDYAEPSLRHKARCTDWVCDVCNVNIPGNGISHANYRETHTDGCTTYYQCRYCDHTINRVFHRSSTVEYSGCVTNETCKTCGFVETYDRHVWTGDCNKSVTCRRCAEVQSGPIDHQYNTYLFGFLNTCRICGRIAFFAGHFSSLAFVFPGALLVLIALVIVIIKFRNSGEGDRKTKFIGFIENYQRPGLKGNGRLGDALTVHILKDDETPPD